MENNLALESLRKKLMGKKLTYKEIYSIMDEISKSKFGDILTTYFAAAGYSEGFSNEELFFLTKAMVETGERLHFPGIVADKHSILDKEKIYKVVKKTNACIVWGGSVNIAPADDILIQVEKPLLFESYDKIIVSIMAKKIAFGSNHVVIDLPYGEMVKVNNLKEAEIIKEKFQYVASKFKIKIKVLIHKTDEPAGRGIGPILETREALKVLEQKKDRSLDLEIRGLDLAANLLELCLRDSNEKNKKYVEKVYGNCYGWAADILKSGRALKKMQEIIKAQGGNPNVTSDKLKPAKHSVKITAARNCEIKSMNSKNITYIARLLGAPDQKKSGIYLNKKMGEEIEKSDTICTLYSENVYNLKEAKDSLKNFPIFTLK